MNNENTIEYLATQIIKLMEYIADETGRPTCLKAECAKGLAEKIKLIDYNQRNNLPIDFK